MSNPDSKPKEDPCDRETPYLDDATLDDIASELTVSKERVRQIREAAEAKPRADFVVLALWQSCLVRGR